MSDSGAKSVGPLSIRQWFAVALAAIAVLFIVQNRDKANVNLLFFEFVIPLWIALLAVFLGGAVCGVLWSRKRAKK